MYIKTVLWTYFPRYDGSCDIKLYVYTERGKRYYSTGLKVKPEDWDDRNGFVKKSHPGYIIYNAKIRALRNKLEEHFLNGGSFQNLDLERTDAEKNSLILFLEKHIEEADRGLHGLRAGTVKNYRATLRRLKEFAEDCQFDTITFQDIDIEFYNNFKLFLEAKAKCGPVGIGKHMKIIKRLMNVSLENNLHENTAHKHSAFKALRSEKSGKIYLTTDEIAAITNLDLKALPHLEKERDRFLMAYYLFLRFSDVIALNRTHFFENNGEEFYRSYHEKTGHEVTVPLNSQAKKLVRKYNYSFNFSSNPQANRMLKEIAAMAGLNHPVKQDGVTLPKCQFVVTHTARRSAATNLYLEGASLRLIADLGGWENTRTLMLYLRASGLDSAKMARQFKFFS